MILITRMGTSFLVAAVILGLMLSLDPYNAAFGISGFPIVKFLPYIFSSFALVLLGISVRFLKVSLSFCLVSVFLALALAGSLFPLIMYNALLEETFLGRLLGGSAFFAAYLLSGKPIELNLFYRFLAPALYFFTFVAFLFLLVYNFGFAYQGLDQIYQVKVSLFMSAVVFAYLNEKRLPIKYFVISLGMITTFLVSKSTAYLAIVCTLSYMTWVGLTGVNIKSLSYRHKLLLGGGVFFGLIAILFLAFFGVYYVIQGRLNDRGFDVRQTAISSRILEFFDSPFLGSAFTSSPLIDFGPLHIPSHTDLLDLLAAGGTVTILMFYSPLLVSVWRSVSKAGVRLDMSNYPQYVSFNILIFFVVMAVNPVLFLPGVSILFWVSIGLMLGQNAAINNQRSMIC